MAGTADNYTVTAIPQGVIARLYSGMAIPAAGARATLFSDGTPDATANPNAKLASGDIAVGVGVGANVLFGGSNRTIALQPLSVEGQAGLNVSLGVSGLTLVLAP